MASFNWEDKGILFCLLLLLMITGMIIGQDFDVPITVSDGQYSYVLTIGVDPNGTPGYDPGLDLYAPPPPPSGAFDARLTWLGEDYFADIRGNSLTQKTFIMNYQASANAGPIVLSWNAALLNTLGSFLIVDRISGTLVNLDMSSVDSISVNDFPALSNGLEIRVTPYPVVDISSSPALLNRYPDTPVLFPNYPNPFNGSTVISFYLPRETRIELNIYDTAGRIIKELASGNYQSGNYSLMWDGKTKGGDGVSSGIYYCVLTCSTFREVIQILLVK